MYGWGKSVRSVHGVLKLGLCLNSFTGRCTVHTRHIFPATEQKKIGSLLNNLEFAYISGIGYRFVDLLRLL